MDRQHWEVMKKRTSNSARQTRWCGKK